MDGRQVELRGGRFVQLGYWGRSMDGRWWAYLWWWAPAEPFRPAETQLAGQQVLCVGWTWSSTVRPVIGVDYADVPRVELLAGPDSWPNPAVDWAVAAGVPIRHQGLMGLTLGSPPDEPEAELPPRRPPREHGSGQTLAERAGARLPDPPEGA